MPAALPLLAVLASAQGDARSEPTVMIVELHQAASYIGEPKQCPGDTAEEPDAESICIAELYQGPARVVRHLAGTRLSREPAPLRFTGHAMRRWRGMRLLVVTVPFEDQGTRGNFAPWWQFPEENGDYCLPTEEVEKMAPGPVRRAFDAGYARRFKADGYLEADRFRCVRG